MAGQFNNEPGRMDQEHAEALIDKKSASEAILWAGESLKKYSSEDRDTIEDVLSSKFHVAYSISDELYKDIKQKGADKWIEDISKIDDKIIIQTEFAKNVLYTTIRKSEDPDCAKVTDFLKAKDPVSYYMAKDFAKNFLKIPVNSADGISTEQLKVGASKSNSINLILAMGNLPLDFTKNELPHILGESIKNNLNLNAVDSHNYSAQNWKDFIEHGLMKIEEQFPTEINADAYRKTLLEIPEIKHLYEMATKEKVSLNSPATPETPVTPGQDNLSQDQADLILAFMQKNMESQQANQAPSQG